MAPGRLQEEPYDFGSIFVDIVRCPVKFMYYLKFHGARTAFGRVIGGKITSPYGARPAFAHIGRASQEFGNKKARRALGRSPEEKVKGHSGAI